MADINGLPAGKQPSFRPSVTVVLLLLFGLFIAYGTLLPFEFGATSKQVVYRRHQFFTLSLAEASRTDLIGNVLLFIPWGGLMAVWLAGRRVAPGAALVAAAASGCALSSLVETLQVYSPLRVSSWIDVATNTVGSALGGGLGWWLARVFWPGVEATLNSRAARHPLAVLTAVSALGVLMASLAPFDVSVDVSDLRASVKGARLVPFSTPIDHPSRALEAWGWAGEVLVWTMLGGLCALSLVEARFAGPQGAAVTVTAAVAMSAFIELLQVTIRSRRPDTTSVVLAGAGAAIGALLVVRNPRKSPRSWVGVALVLWALAIVLEAWAPPQFSASGHRDLAWEMFIPFWAYYRRTDIHALADVIVQTLRYLPLGALLALRFDGNVAWRVAAIGLSIGLGLEVGQFFLENRSPEVTDALSGAVGSWLGFTLARFGALHMRRRPEACASQANERRVTARPPSGGPAAPGGQRREGASRFAGYVRAPALRLTDATIAWLNKQSYVVQLTAICLAVLLFVVGVLILCRVLDLL
jgi:glycopeptide antibiotics resistance protein